MREIFEAALDRPAGERRAFVEQACGGDTMLVAEVERMLAADNQGHQLLDRGPNASDHTPATCPACHAALVQSHRFCPSCGTPLVEDAGPRAGRFRAGALFAHRFRIVARLGHGGMGEVYRADDLEVGQPVALKFLTAFRSDERARARLRSEVRLARQISHPNVCRVYDIGEAHGELYLSMEYVDGEDLAALLKRIGRLPIDKGVEIARRLCAGLTAAHAKGVLHRDFKPANIMIDGLGEVRIMDFGLAAIADQLEAKDVRSGTPAYMAPEQLAGREATKQSDLYSLGLVLYELFTGKPPFAAQDLHELQRQRETMPATTPSTLIPEIGPRVEQTILRCLEPDPRQRPSSALDVAASLPGGDPLAEALAAGETPSPEMVANAGSIEGLQPRVAIACLVGIAACLALAFFLAPRSEMVNRLPLDYPPDVLSEKAREIIRSAGYVERPVDFASGFQVDDGYVSHFDRALGKSGTATAATWARLLSISPSPVSFWYRQSQNSLAPRTSNEALAGRVQNQPPSTVAGTESVDLDPNGRLRRFVAAPSPSHASASGANSTPDWSVLFKAAGLDSSNFRPADATSLATEATDTSAAWIGMYPGHDDLPVRIEARGNRGRATYFAVIFPWMNAPDQSSRGNQMLLSRASAANAIVVLVMTVAVAFVSYYNWKAGRADLAGASRVGIFICLTLLVLVILGAHDVMATLIDQPALPIVAFNGLIGALAYIAIEPWVRRLWPQAMISWSRVLSGRWRDPIVARDVLVAILLALLTHCVRQGLYAYFMPGRGAAPSTGRSFGFSVDYLMGPRLVASNVAGYLGNGFGQAFQTFFLLFLCRALLRKAWLGALVFVAGMALIIVRPLSGGPGQTWIDSISLMIVFVVLALPIMIRFGFFAFAVWGFIGGLITQALLTSDFGAWYGQSSLVVLVVFSALALWAFRTSLGGRPLLAKALDARP